jgi:hypothetical protein
MFYFVKLGGCHMDRNENLFFSPRGIVFYFWILWTMQHLPNYIERTNLCKKKKPRLESLTSKYTYFEYLVTKHIAYSRDFGFWRNMISWTNVYNNLACIKCTTFTYSLNAVWRMGGAAAASPGHVGLVWLCLLFWPCLPRQGYCV